LAYYSTSLVLNSLTSKVIYLASPKSTLALAQKKEGLHNNKRSVGDEETSSCFLFFLQFQNVSITKPSIESEGTPVSTELLSHLTSTNLSEQKKRLLEAVMEQTVDRSPVLPCGLQFPYFDSMEDSNTSRNFDAHLLPGKDIFASPPAHKKARVWKFQTQTAPAKRNEAFEKGQRGIDEFRRKKGCCAFQGTSRFFVCWYDGLWWSVWSPKSS
jgi:hypothetical protein